MKKLMNKVEEKLFMAKIERAMKMQDAKEVLANNRGEGYLDTVIKLLIAVVLGALLLAGLHALFGDVVLPRLEQEVNDMFNY